MKKLIFVIVCIVIIIAGGIIEQYYVDHSFNKLNDKVDEVLISLENSDFDKASSQIDDMQSWWYKRRDVLEFLCPNNDIKDIAKEIGELQGATLAEGDEDPQIRCNVIKEMAKNSKNLLAFKWKNIL